MNTTLTLNTKSSSVTLLAGTNAPLLQSFRKSGTERAISTPIALPAAYQREGETLPFSWTCTATEQGKENARLLYADKAAGVTYTITLKARADLDGPVEYAAVLTNLSSKTLRILPGTLFSATFAFPTPPTAWTFMKESGVAEGVRWNQSPNTFFPGTGIYKDPVTKAPIVCETNTNQDFNAGGKIPIIYLDGGDKGAYIAFEWTSSRLIASPAEGGTRVTLDLREGFSTRIPSGGDFILPPIYLGVYDGDVDDGSNCFKRWFFLEKAPATVRQNENEPLTQMDYQLHPSMVPALGIQSIKWDYGWWAAEGSHLDGWTIHEGSWQLRRAGMLERTKEQGVTDMASYGDYLHSLGLNWTVYVLLHDSRVPLTGDEQMTSVGETAHPEWFSHRKIAGVCPVADLGNEECVAYCKRKLHQFFTENHVDGWRTDFEPIAHVSDKENRHDANGTDVQYWCSRGFYDIVDYLIETIPGFRFESCCSGGAMKDYATMHRTPVFNNDDSADYLSLRTTFYDSSYCFPPAQLQSPCNPDTFCPDSGKYYAHLGDKDFGMRAMIMGGVMLASWSGAKDGHLQYDLEHYYEKYLTLHNEKIKPLIRHANLYHTLPRPDSIHWDGMQYGTDTDPANHIGGALFLFKPTNEEGNEKHVAIRGLNPNLTYRATFYEREEQSFVMTGKALMEKGLTCRIEEACGSEIVFFEIIETK